MSTVGQMEKRTQARVVALLREQLGYEHLGDWSDREASGNIEEDLLRACLRDTQRSDEALIGHRHRGGDEGHGEGARLG